MVMRGCLENALYGLYVLHKDSGAFDRWMCRHDSDDAKRIVRNEFTIACVKKTLEDMDPKHVVVVSQLYDKTVDIGAHPNVAVSAALKTSRSEGRIQFKVLYLTADPEVIVRHAEIGRAGWRCEPADIQERVPGTLQSTRNQRSAGGFASRSLTRWWVSSLWVTFGSRCRRKRSALWMTRTVTGGNENVDLRELGVV